MLARGSTIDKVVGSMKLKMSKKCLKNNTEWIILNTMQTEAHPQGQQMSEKTSKAK